MTDNADSANKRPPLWSVRINGHDFKIGAWTRDAAIAYLRVTFPQSDVDYQSLKPCESL